MGMEFGNCPPLVCRYEGIGQRRLWRLDWGNRRLYGPERAWETVYGQDRTVISHRW
jgi:hypothetical protein